LDVIVISRPTTSGSNPSPVKFLVVYSDISNNGILTTAIGSVFPPSSPHIHRLLSILCSFSLSEL
jgi:hypothetical protein